MKVRTFEVQFKDETIYIGALNQDSAIIYAQAERLKQGKSHKVIAVDGQPYQTYQDLTVWRLQEEDFRAYMPSGYTEEQFQQILEDARKHFYIHDWSEDVKYFIENNLQEETK